MHAVSIFPEIVVFKKIQNILSSLFRNSEIEAL